MKNAFRIFFYAGWKRELLVIGIVQLTGAVQGIGIASIWPIVALVRRRYKYKSDVTGRALRLHRGTRITAWLIIALGVGWFLVLNAVNNDLTSLNGGLDIWMRLLQLLLIVVIVGTLVAIWNAYSVARSPGKHKVAMVWAVLVAAAAAFLVWLFLDLGLLTTSLNY